LRAALRFYHFALPLLVGEASESRFTGLTFANLIADTKGNSNAMAIIVAFGVISINVTNSGRPEMAQPYNAPLYAESANKRANSGQDGD
jgi:hypothetical protein